MKNSGKIIIISALLFLTGLRGASQANVQRADSLQIRTQQRTSAETGGLQLKSGKEGMQNTKGNVPKNVKRVRAGHPDMTKARGARPPLIVRPSGSGIPKGVGRPGGAGRKVGR